MEKGKSRLEELTQWAENQRAVCFDVRFCGQVAGLSRKASLRCNRRWTNAAAA